MATRPVFLIRPDGSIKELDIQFTWTSGWSNADWQTRIRNLHEAAQRAHPGLRLLEISSRSEDPAGQALSAFALQVQSGVSVESAYQAGKVFRDGGPYGDLMQKSSRDAKKDPRLRSSGPLTGFRFEGKDWSLEPKTAFYNWLYLQALRNNPERAKALEGFDGFTDIFFNPARMVNCQARAAALHLALKAKGMLETALAGPGSFLETAGPLAP